MTDDERMSLDELQRLMQAHQAEWVIIPEQKLDELGIVDYTSLNTTISSSRELLCRECFIATRSIVVAAWPCTTHKLLARNQEMTELVQRLWGAVHHLDRENPFIRQAYEHLGLHVER
jgi:hypothetical protein